MIPVQYAHAEKPSEAVDGIRHPDARTQHVQRKQLPASLVVVPRHQHVQHCWVLWEK